ncbi:hypothetical protein SAMN04489726_0114 [Allokutzneria albata]|uniref:Uncharacterized protein n=1 Tax=Allokutzneria albata TaxID=211114 RepID=A0A1G9QZK9_ALLAB|nr:hypothetical protein SAMN04489726_0114 [Allokutzneria albata]
MKNHTGNRAPLRKASMPWKNTEIRISTGTPTSAGHATQLCQLGLRSTYSTGLLVSSWPWVTASKQTPDFRVYAPSTAAPCRIEMSRFEVPPMASCGSTQVLMTAISANGTRVATEVRLPTTLRISAMVAAPAVGMSPNSAPAATSVHAQSPGQTLNPNKRCRPSSTDSSGSTDPSSNVTGRGSPPARPRSATTPPYSFPGQSCRAAVRTTVQRSRRTQDRR